jgi:hypothetical protein
MRPAADDEEHRQGDRQEKEYENVRIEQHVMGSVILIFIASINGQRGAQFTGHPDYAIVPDDMNMFIKSTPKRDIRLIPYQKS